MLGKLLYEPFKVFRLVDRAPVKRSGSPGLTNRKCACGVAANRGQKTNDIAPRHPEKLSERSQLHALW